MKDDFADLPSDHNVKSCTLPIGIYDLKTFLEFKVIIISLVNVFVQWFIHNILHFLPV